MANKKRRVHVDRYADKPKTGGPDNPHTHDKSKSTERRKVPHHYLGRVVLDTEALVHDLKDAHPRVKFIEHQGFLVLPLTRRRLLKTMDEIAVTGLLTQLTSTVDTASRRAHIETTGVLLSHPRGVNGGANVRMEAIRNPQFKSTVGHEAERCKGITPKGLATVRDQNYDASFIRIVDGLVNATVAQDIIGICNEHDLGLRVNLSPVQVCSTK